MPSVELYSSGCFCLQTKDDVSSSMSHGQIRPSKKRRERKRSSRNASSNSDVDDSSARASKLLVNQRGMIIGSYSHDHTGCCSTEEAPPYAKIEEEEPSCDTNNGKLISCVVLPDLTEVSIIEMSVTEEELRLLNQEARSSVGFMEAPYMELEAAAAQIEKEAQSPDTNDPGLLTCEDSPATCMAEVDFCEKGHNKGLVSSANTNVGKDEVRAGALLLVRGIDVIS